MALQRLTISQIKFHNYRPFEDIEIKLSQDEKQTMTIICGNNSRGKTVIMNAIHWALYGIEPFWMNGGIGKPIINQRILNQTKVGESCEASAMIEFSNNKGPTMSITRKIFAKRETDSRNKIDNPIAGGQVDDGLAFFRTCEYQEKKPDGNWLAAEDEQEIDGYIQRFLPKDLAQFVIFNGEMLDQFFRSESAKNIREGIENVSGLGITKEGIYHAEKVAKIFSKNEAKDAGSKATQASAQKEVAEQRHEKLVSEQTVDQKKYQGLEIAEAKLRTELDKFSESKIETLEQLKIEQVNKKANLVELQNSCKEKKINIILPNLSKLILKDCLYETKEVLRQSELRKETPPVVLPEFIDQKISDGICMCGKKLDDAGIDILNKLKNTIINSELTEIANEGKITLSAMDKEFNEMNFLDELKDLREKMKKYEDEYDKTTAKIDSLLNTLKEHKIEDVRKIASDLKDILLDRSQLKTKIDQREVRIESAQIEIERFQEAVDVLGKITKAGQMWIKKRKLAEKIANTLSDLRLDVISQIRESVQLRTEELWTGLIARGSEIDKVLIDKDYNIRVIDKDGADSLRSLSAGQTLYLALSFISAVRDATDTNYPMIIDSPFGKIDGPSREEAAKTMPKYIPGTQVTLLVTDSEFYATIENKQTGEIYPPISTVLKDNERIWKVENLQLEKTSETSSKTVLLVK